MMEIIEKDGLIGYSTLTISRLTGLGHQKLKARLSKMNVQLTELPKHDYLISPPDMLDLLNYYLTGSLPEGKKEIIRDILMATNLSVIEAPVLNKNPPVNQTKKPKMNGNKFQKPLNPVNQPNLTERLPQIGKTVFSWVGSLIVLFAFYLFLILVEAYFQAELIHLKTGMSLPLWFGFMFCMLFGLVLFSVNGKYANGENENGETIFVLLFFFYNFAMSELRFFHDFDGELFSFDTATLALIGFIVPLFILKVGMVVNERVKEMQSV